MGNQHTQGPWKWHRRYTSDDRNGCIFSEPSEGHAHAIAMQPRYSSNEQWAADCKLIVAAPDLLALLKDLIDMEGPCPDPGTPEWATKVRAAIAKAEGNSDA